MGWFHKEDAARRAYIELLRERVNALDTLPSDRQKSMLYAELIAAGYLDGDTHTDQYGVPDGNVIIGVTVKGRLFLQELEAREREQSWRGRVKKLGLVIFGFVVGIVSHVLPDFLKSLWTHTP
jgi:hypothetical protein